MTKGKNRNDALISGLISAWRRVRAHSRCSQRMATSVMIITTIIGPQISQSYLHRLFRVLQRPSGRSGSWGISIPKRLSARSWTAHPRSHCETGLGYGSVRLLPKVMTMVLAMETDRGRSCQIQSYRLQQVNRPGNPLSMLLHLCSNNILLLYKPVSLCRSRHETN